MRGPFGKAPRTCPKGFMVKHIKTKACIIHRFYNCALGRTLILISLHFSCQSLLAYDLFFEPDYPFRPFVREIPASVLEKIQDNDILFVGETHIASSVLREKKSNAKNRNTIGRRNSLNQENLYFNLVKKFSETHPDDKKCLWLEYFFDDPDIEKKLNGLNEGRSHYWLIRTAIAQGWSVFAVDVWSPVHADYSKGRRDHYMALNITKTFQNGQCEKGISINGSMHLSCTAEYPTASCKDNPKMISYLRDLDLSGSPLDKRLKAHLKNVLSGPPLDKLLKAHLKNIGAIKSIGILRIVIPLF